MSLVKTLGKIAMGVAVAKGVGKMMERRRGAGGSSLGSGRDSGLGAGTGGGLGGMLGEILGGSGHGGSQADRARTAGSSPGMGGALGDLGALLGGRPGQAGSAGGTLAGGLGGLLNSIGGRSGGTTAGGSSAGGQGTGSAGGFGDLLNAALRGEEVADPPREDEEHARVLLQAMINAAKSDGTIDAAEEQRLMQHLGSEVTEEDRRFVLEQMREPLDVDAFAASVPRGHEHEVYLMSLMAIDLDSKQEAHYLDKLRRGLGLSESMANALHEKLGVPVLYN